MNAWTRCWLCLAWLAVAAAPALAQPMPNNPERRPYVTFDIDKDAADRITKRFEIDKNLGPVKDLISQILKDQTSLNPDLIKKLAGATSGDAKLQGAIQDMVRNDPALQEDLRKWISNAKAGKPAGEVAKELDKFEKVLKPAGAHAPNHDAGKPAPAPKQDTKPDETYRRLVEGGIKKFEASELGDWMRGSPAWQQAVRDLRTSIDRPQASKWKITDWASKLLTPDGKGWKLGEATLDRLKNMPRPDLEHWNQKLTLPGLGNIPTPNLGPPALPRFSAPSLNAGATWLLLALLCLLVGWQMIRWSKRAAVERVPALRLGPWPVKPGDVATRADLVQAFDYLAILTLGLDAKSWNHEAIARHWCANSPANAPSANALVRLYEQARYTDGPSELMQPQRDQARQALLQLAEAR